MDKKEIKPIKTAKIPKNIGSKKHVPEIVQMGHPALHTESKEVPLSEIGSEKINNVIDQMILALESQKDGVGIAAPQIGIPLRIFIVAGLIYDRMQADIIRAKHTSLELAKAEIKKLPKNPHRIFINPVITKESKEKKWMDGEGCLSVRWLYGKVRRSIKVTLRSYDEKGVLTERGAGGFLAHIFQHEVDHLNGILFIDKAKDIEEYDPAEIQKETEENNKY